MTEPTLYEEVFADIKSRLSNPKLIYTLNNEVEQFSALATGISEIDKCLEGGFPEGRITEISGPEASGKTTVMLHLIAAAQTRGEVVYYIDAEHALDYQYAQRIGVDLDTLLFAQPDTGEQALDTARIICESTMAVQEKRKQRVRTLIVVDSIPALVPAEMFEKIGKDGFETTSGLGLTARMLSSKLPPLVAMASKANVTVVFINQEREKIGVTYGSPITTPGGKAMKFFASLRLRVSRIGYYDEGGQRAGIRAKLVPMKSKLFPIFNREANFIIGPNGIDIESALVETALAQRVIKKSGAWLKFGEITAQGHAAFAQKVRDDADLKRQLTEAVNPKPQVVLQPTNTQGPAPTGVE